MLMNCTLIICLIVVFFFYQTDNYWTVRQRTIGEPLLLKTSDEQLN
jgi:hypothetical protein